MTEKLYYRDPYLFEFEAAILRAATEEGGFGVVLDRTCFYPGGGGQPSDRGKIGGIPVTDVREEGEEIVHVMASRPAGPTVRGSIDSGRRLDFMAQHTGQHILSHALLETSGLETVSVHFGDETTTVELKAAELSEEAARAAEELANGVIKENRAVTVREVGTAEARELPLRRPPPEEERIRVVEVESFDLAACGGVHVARTGEIFLVKIVSTERIRGRVRLHAFMGKRAFLDYGRKIALIQTLSRLLTCSEADMTSRIEGLLAASRGQARALTGLRVEQALVAADNAVAAGGPVASHVFDGIGQEPLKAFVERILAKPGFTAVAVDRTAEGFQWIVAHSVPGGPDLPALLAPVLDGLGARGGGKGPRMQGAGKDTAGASAFAERIARELRGRLA